MEPNRARATVIRWPGMNSSTRESLSTLIADAERALGPLAERDGRILYSSIDTLRPGKLYLLGLNPGDGCDRYHQIGESLRDMPNHASNTYLDDDWGRGIGGHHTQQRVCFVLRALGHDPRDVFATNLVFARSKSWTKEQSALVPVCLRVHRMFLSIIQPRVVLTFGREAFQTFLRASDQAGVTAFFDTGVPNGAANFSCYANDVILFRQNLRVVCLPHLSKFKIDAQPKTVNWLREMSHV